MKDTFRKDYLRASLCVWIVQSKRRLNYCSVVPRNLHLYPLASPISLCGRLIYVLVCCELYKVKRRWNYAEEVLLFGGTEESSPVSSGVADIAMRSAFLAFLRAAKRSFTFFSLRFSSRRVELLLSFFSESSSSRSEYAVSETGGWTWKYKC